MRQNVNTNLTNTKTVIIAQSSVQSSTRSVAMSRSWKGFSSITNISETFKQSERLELDERWSTDLLPTHMKNCEPLVSFPLFAIDSRNSFSCFIEKLSSGKWKLKINTHTSKPVSSDCLLVIKLPSK